MIDSLISCFRVSIAPRCPEYRQWWGGVWQAILAFHGFKKFGLPVI